MLFTFLALAAALLISCRKNSEEAPVLLQDDEAAEVVETAVSGRSAGATMPGTDMTTLVESGLPGCGETGDTTLQRSNTAGPFTYNCSYQLSWVVNCNNFNIPQSADISLQGNGSFNGQRWSGSQSSNGALNLSGLNPQATEYTVNGSYTRQGELTGNLRHSNPTLNTSTDVNLSGMTIRKSDKQIAGGNGTALITASNGKGQTQTINATLIFNGDGTATVTVNGYSYTFLL